MPDELKLSILKRAVLIEKDIIKKEEKHSIKNIQEQEINLKHWVIKKNKLLI